MAIPSIAAVIFDMDGVILDTERLAMRAWMGAAAEHGFELPEAVYHGLIGLSGPEGRRYLQSHAWSDAAIDRLDGTAWALYVDLLKSEGVPHKEGLFELLDFLDFLGLRRAVATSTNTHLAEANLGRAGVLDRFGAIVGGDQVKRGKPAPDIYLLAAERLACAPAECLVLEDSRNGVRAGVAAGMAVILVPDLCPIDEETRGLATGVAASLLEVIPLLAGSRDTR